MKHRFFLLFIWIIFSNNVSALVKYDEGRIVIDGVQLLQDKDNELSYYYIPQYPKLAQKEDGSFELLCMKYIGEGENGNGGIFHALIEFTLPEEVILSLESKLEKLVPGAKIVGSVPLKQVMKDGEDGLAGFKVVSSILNNTEGKNAFSKKIITSGFAPLLPGSRAAISAKLTQQGATLLWESLQGATSDVSIAISGYYEAYVKGYNATITAEVSTIYEHLSRIFVQQKGFTKREMRNITDELIQDNILNIKVFDRSKALGIKSDDASAILDLVTDKLIDLMFNAETGWAKIPPTTVAVEQGQIKGRQERGWFSRVFGGAQDEKYQTDNQYVLKKQKNIKIHKFYLNLSKATTIKVPIYTTGNIGGLFFKNHGGKDSPYFKVVNLADSDFSKRKIQFQLDGNYVESFNDIINSVSVSFKKSYSDNFDDVTEDFVISGVDISKNSGSKSIIYPRLGIKGADWLNYDYKLSWSFIGNNEVVNLPKGGDLWLHASSPGITLIPPFDKRKIVIDADRSFFMESDVKAVNLRFFVILNGKPVSQKQVILRDSDTEATTNVVLYCDKGEPIIYQLIWYKKGDPIKEQPKELSDDYLFLIPPNK